MPHTTSPLKSKLVVVFIAALVTALSWLGKVDQISDDYLDEALLTGGAVYATARGINALVSFAQGTEIDAPFVTLTIGEVLDPLNDFIEQFSTVVLIALGSLALQKLLLTVVSDNFFSGLLTLSVLYLLMASFFSSLRFDVARKIFIISLFARYSIALVVIASSAIDKHFLADNDEERHMAMSKLRTELSSIQSTGVVSQDTTSSILALKEDLVTLNSEKSAVENALSETLKSIENEEAQLKSLKDDQGILKRRNPFAKKPEEILLIEKEIKDLSDISRQQREAINALDTSIEGSSKTLACLEKREKGKPCGYLEGLKDRISWTAYRQWIHSIESRTEDFTSNAISLLVSLLVKTILLPLLFLMFAARSFRWIVPNPR